MPRGKKKPTEQMVQLEAELAPARAEGSEILTYLSTVVIETGEQAQAVKDFCVVIATRRKELEAKQASILDPAKATVKAIQAVFGPLIETYESAERAGKNAVLKAMQAQAEKEKAALAAYTGDATQVLVVVENAIPKPVGTQIRTTKVAEVSDQAECMKHLCELYLAGFTSVPLMINEVALRRMEHEASSQIRGVTIVEKQTAVFS